MSSQPSKLFSLARSKLHLSVGGKDSCGLRRWVLLKNSIVKSSLPPAPDTPNVQPLAQPLTLDDESFSDEEADLFMFPDTDIFLDGPPPDAPGSEAEWLDSLLESLGDEDDDFNVDVQVHVAPTDDDDDDEFLSPLQSPVSSSDDLVNHAYYLPPIYPPVSYPSSSPYSSARTPLIHSCPCPFPLYDDPLPYHDPEDVEELPVPDAIEDTSDDESDIVSTPSIGRSSSSFSLDPATVPLPADRRYINPHVYGGMDDSYYSRFDIDPLPLPRPHPSPYNNYRYQEC